MSEEIIQEEKPVVENTPPKPTTITMEPFTVFMMMGGSGSGKSSLVQRLVSEIYEKYDNTDLARSTNPVSVISSDGWRQFFSTTHDNRSPRKMQGTMDQSSEQAFVMLEAELKANMSFPINTPYIFVDTTALNPDFRKYVQGMTRKYNYNLVVISINLDHRDINSTIAPEGYQEKRVRNDALVRMRKQIADIGIRNFKDHIRIRRREPNWDNIQVQFNEDMVKNHKDSTISFEKDKVYAVIGDIHESVDALKELTDKLFEKHGDNLRLFSVGDYLDKGDDTVRTLELVKSLVDRGMKIVHANHEAYVWQRLVNNIEKSAHEDTFATAVPILQENEYARNLFLDIFENHTLPFVRLTGLGNRDIYITHVPCPVIDMGRLTASARGRQRSLYIDPSLDDPRRSYHHVFDEAAGNQPHHVFGHICHGDPYVSFRNKHFIDTGAVHGGKLTAFMYAEGGRHEPWLVQVDAEKRNELGLPKGRTTPIKEEKPFNIDDYAIDDFQRRSLFRFAKGPACWIGGTMSPSSAIPGDREDQSRGQLEPVSTAIKYFMGKGVKKLAVEPKYMGSRLTLHLFRNDKDKTMATMRSGMRNNKRHDPLIERICQQYIEVTDKLFGTQWEHAVIDGELTPWALIGENLIETEFYQYAAHIQRELDILANDEAFNEMQFGQDFQIEARQEGLAKFMEQLELHGQFMPFDYDINDPRIKFNAFGYLKVDDKIFGSLAHPEHFEALRDDTVLILDLEELGQDSATQAAEEFMQGLVGAGMEGVVFKVMGELPDDCVVNMKVRNEQYLRIIYGYDYDLRYNEHCASKNTYHKLRTSRKEYEMGLKLLENNPARKLEWATKITAEINRESTLDPRL